jgi:hypothetical protein
MAFELLLLGLAVDAELGHRTRLEALETDLLAAALALAVHALLDLLEGLHDLAEQSALALPEAPLEGEVRLGRGRVDLVREVIRVEVDVTTDGLLRLPGQLIALLDQDFPELVEVPLSHPRLLTPLPYPYPAPSSFNCCRASSARRESGYSFTTRSKAFSAAFPKFGPSLSRASPCR